MSDNKPDTSEETFQEDTTPVQAFTTPVVPAGLPSENRSRHGRPPRVSPVKPRESAGAATTASTATWPLAEFVGSSGGVAAAIGSTLTPAMLGASCADVATGSVGAVASFAAGAAAGAAIGALLGGASGAVIGAQVGAALAAQTEAAKKQSSSESAEPLNGLESR